MKMIIKNGTIVTASEMYEADIEADDGIITKIEKNMETSLMQLVNIYFREELIPMFISNILIIRIISKMVQGQPLLEELQLF